MARSSSEGYGPAVAVDAIPDKRAYEEACADAVRTAFQPPKGTAFHEWLADTGRSLQDARLDGNYPDTILVVTMKDDRYGHDREFSYDLWGDAARPYAPPGMQPAPDLMATNIVDWTMEE